MSDTDSNYNTPQEAFWAGEFGNEYVQRNRGAKIVSSNLALFSRALKQCQRVGSVIEYGANIGLNLTALKLLHPDQKQFAVEINPTAVSRLKEALPECTVYQESILNFNLDRMGQHVDLALIKGVLIHINPDCLPNVYDLLCGSTTRYLFVCEYYNPTPVSVNYRGQSDRLFKRDFCGEILDRHPEFCLLDYGFVYHRDPVFPADDITWFLLEKNVKR